MDSSYVSHLRFVHLAALVTVVGVPLGTALVKVAAYRDREPSTVLRVTRVVERVDVLVVAPSVVLQFVSGYLLAGALGWSLWAPWLATALMLYGVIGACWAVAIWTQRRMHRLAAGAVEGGEGLPGEYRRYMRAWTAVGMVALAAVIAVFVLMVYRPQL